MPTAELPEAILLDEPDPARFEAAAKLLEQAAKAGSSDGSIHYLLALAYKRLGKLPEARAALRKITPADAGVWLQMGLLSIGEGVPQQAEQEFSRAWELTERPGLQFSRAQALRRLGGRTQEAIDLYQAHIDSGETRRAAEAGAFIERLNAQGAALR